MITYSFKQIRDKTLKGEANGLHQNLKFCSAKDPVKGMERQARLGEKYLKPHT